MFRENLTHSKIRPKNDRFFILNLKTYKKGYGNEALKIAKILEDFQRKVKVKIGVAVSPTDIRMIVEECDIGVFAQHIDNIGFGAHTGYILPEAVAESGAIGSLINHAEHRLTLSEIHALIQKCHSLDLTAVVCTNNVATTKAASVLEPDLVAVEPPELIGGDVSVSTARPEVITASVEAVKQIAPKVGVLCGAGVKTEEDVRRAIELGSQGILLASGVVKASDPKKVTEDMLRGFGEQL
ncbi:MAG TPA: triose-phosphate isomerase [Thermoplasmata archaeon]|nr:triose-phosphate isomerase [Thermoplasmata archaeon]